MRDCQFLSSFVSFQFLAEIMILGKNFILIKLVYCFEIIVICVCMYTLDNNDLIHPLLSFMMNLTN